MFNAGDVGVGNSGGKEVFNGGRERELCFGGRGVGRYGLGPMVVLLIGVNLSSYSRAKLTARNKDGGHWAFTSLLMSLCNPLMKQ